MEEKRNGLVNLVQKEPHENIRVTGISLLHALKSTGREAYPEGLLSKERDATLCWDVGNVDSMPYISCGCILALGGSTSLSILPFHCLSFLLNEGRLAWP